MRRPYWKKGRHGEDTTIPHGSCCSSRGRWWAPTVELRPLDTRRRLQLGRCKRRRPAAQLGAHTAHKAVSSPSRPSRHVAPFTCAMSATLELSSQLPRLCFRLSTMAQNGNMEVCRRPPPSRGGRPNYDDTVVGLVSII